MCVLLHPCLGLLLILGLHILLDVGGHVCLGPVDPLKVSLKGSIRKHF